MNNYQVTSFSGVLEVKRIKTVEEKIFESKNLDNVECTWKRGKVERFTNQSRRRLFKQLLKLNTGHEYHFITLTYPKEYSLDFAVWKADLHKLSSGLRYHYPKIGFIWKLEYQKRGAPHFHLLAYIPSVHHIKELRDTVRKSWRKIIGETSTRSFQYSVQVDAVQDIKASVFYLALYQTKDLNERTDIPSGRVWGIYGRKHLPTGDCGQSTFSYEEQITLRRIIRRWAKASTRCKGYAEFLRRDRSSSFSCFMKISNQIRLLAYLKNSSDSEALKSPQLNEDIATHTIKTQSYNKFIK